MQKLNLKEEELTLVMTGGPDGDLGRNEIKKSKSKILAIIDSSGVLYDPNPNGIDKKSLMKLVDNRNPVKFY